MPTTDYPGIDYGLGQTNVDRKTGIRYGVIHTNALTEWIWDDVEAEYVPRCPKCGGDAVPTEKLPEASEDWKEAEHDCIAFGCESCEYLFGESGYGDEPDSQYIDKDGIKASVDEMGDVFIIESPYYTYAQFCSPCAPGAGHLENPCKAGPKTFCFGHEWFDGDKAPYPVYRVEDDSIVEPVE